jgi:hypothetical protein
MLEWLDRSQDRIDVEYIVTGCWSTAKGHEQADAVVLLKRSEVGWLGNVILQGWHFRSFIPPEIAIATQSDIIQSWPDSEDPYAAYYD